MKSLMIFITVLAPTLAAAGGLKRDLNASGPCRFGTRAEGHSVIEHKNKGACAEKICTHTIVCQDKYVKVVDCKAKAGLCSGYSADECLAAATSTDAEYDATTVP